MTIALPIVLLLAAAGRDGAASEAAAAAAARDLARGTVYHDADGDRVRDANELGIPGVRVTNGVDVVLTDAAGRWELPVDGDCVLHVVKPAGWMTPVDALMLPRFSYVHRPAGSPQGLAFPGLAPTGDLPASIDFPLDRAAAEAESFRVVVHGDPQPYRMSEVAWFGRDVMAEIVRMGGEGAAFGISLGDLVGDDLALFRPLNEAQAMAGIPWYNVHGNHDMNFLAEDDRHAAETFIRTYGAADYAFQWGRAHFIALDDVVWKGPTYDERGNVKIGNYHGDLHEDQIAFVRNYLATVPTDDLVVLLMHIPLRSEQEQHSVRSRRALLEALSTHPNTLSLSGHTHLQRMLLFGSEDGYDAGTEHLHANLATASGSWYRGALDVEGIPGATMNCGAPNGWTVLQVDGSDYVLDFVPARRPRDHQLHVWIPRDEIPVAEAAGTEVLVNVFAGGPRSTVRMRVRRTDAGPATDAAPAWAVLESVVREDPFLLERKRLEESERPPTGRPLPRPRNCHHLWRGTLPADLAPGHHVIEIEATDMFGRTFSAVRGAWIRP